MKKNKILVAKIFIFIILFSIIGVGLLKFIDNLEANPSDDSFSVFDSISAGTNNLIELLDNEIFNLFDSNMRVNVDTKVSLSNETGTNYEQYTNLFANLSLIATLNYDRDEDYKNVLLTSSKDGKTYKLEYVKNSNGRYIKENDGSFENMSFDTFDFGMLDKTIYSEMVKSFKDVLANKEAIHLTNTISVNNKDYDTEVLSYALTGKELVDMSKTSKSIVNKVFTDIDENTKYIINIFVDTTAKSVIKMTLGEYAKAPAFSYEFLKDYNSIKIGETTYTINGAIDDFNVVIESDRILSASYKKDGNNIFGKVNLKDNGNEIYYLDYNCELEKSTDKSISMSLLIDFYPTNIREGMKVNLNSSILVNKDVNISKTAVSAASGNNSKLTIKEYIDKYLSSMNSYLVVSNQVLEEQAEE